MKRTVKGGRKKQSISASDRQSEKEGLGRAETAAGGCSIPVSQNSRKKAAISRADALKAECDFRSVAKHQIEACCHYEYFRESAVLRRSFARRLHKSSLRISPAADGIVEVSLDNQRLQWQTVIHPESGPAVPRGASLQARQALTFALIKAGWSEVAKKNKLPPSWKTLRTEIKTEIKRCVIRCGQPRIKHPKWHRPLLVQEFSPGHDPGEIERQLEDWKEKAYYDASLDRDYFFGLFRLDETYNETEAVRAFRALFRKRRAKANSNLSAHGKTKGGGGGWRQWQAKLNDLVVMRVWKRFPERKDAIKRVEKVAEFTTAGFEGCKKWWKDRSKARKEKLQSGVDQRISDLACEEMSRARAHALEFFQTLFPDEKPLSY